MADPSPVLCRLEAMLLPSPPGPQMMGPRAALRISCQLWERPRVYHHIRLTAFLTRCSFGHCLNLGVPLASLSLSLEVCVWGVLQLLVLLPALLHLLYCSHKDLKYECNREFPSWLSG